MPLEVATVGQRRGLRLFVIGTLAPAYTSLIWLAGIGLIGRSRDGVWPFKPWVYVGLACAFVAVHLAHASIVYARTDWPAAAPSSTGPGTTALIRRHRCRSARALRPHPAARGRGAAPASRTVV